MAPSARQIQGESYLALKLWFGLKVLLGSKGMCLAQGHNLSWRGYFKIKIYKMTFPMNIKSHLKM